MIKFLGWFAAIWIILFTIGTYILPWIIHTYNIDIIYLNIDIAKYNMICNAVRKSMHIALKKQIINDNDDLNDRLWSGIAFILILYWLIK